MLGGGCFNIIDLAQNNKQRAFFACWLAPYFILQIILLILKISEIFLIN